MRSGQYKPKRTCALRVGAGNWAPENIAAQTEPPFSQNHRKGKRTEPNPPLPAVFRKTSKTHLAGLKSTGGFFFSSKCKTVKPGAVRRAKTDPERSQKANTNS